MGSLIEAVDRRFLFSSLLPSLVFSAALAFVWFPEALLGGSAVPLVLVLVVGGLLGGVLAGATGKILRWYEGYWGRLPVGAVGRRWHLRRLAALADRTELIHLTYPLPSRPEEVMPTGFGNILRSAELYPQDRYGADTAIVWPRLYPVLPDRMVTQLGSARAAVDLLITTSFLAGIFALVSGVSLLVSGGPWWRFLLFFWGGAAFAWIAYLGALPAAVTYGQHIRTAFDLYRHSLLTHLGLGGSDERELWRRLGQHWLRNIPLDADLEPDLPVPPVPPVSSRGPTLPLSAWLGAAVLVAGLLGVLIL